MSMKIGSPWTILYANVNDSRSGTVFGVYDMNEYQNTAMQKVMAIENLGLSTASLRIANIIFW